MDSSDINDDDIEFTYTLGGEIFNMLTRHNLNQSAIMHKRSADLEINNSTNVKKLKHEHLKSKLISKSRSVKSASHNGLSHSGNTNKFEILSITNLNSRTTDGVNFNRDNNQSEIENPVTNPNIRMDKKSNTESANVNNTKNIIFCPPIFVNGISIKTLHDNIKNKFGNNIVVKYISLGYKKFKVFVNNSNVHCKLIEIFRNEMVNAYSFTPKDKKRTVVLLKGMDSDFTPEEIKENILQLVPELKISKIAPFSTGYSKNNNKKLNMFLVQLEPGEEVDKLINIKYLLFQRVYWEKLYKTDIVRCYRCQRFGHSVYFCSFPLKCVLCSENHDLSNCPKKGVANTELKCANCSGNHTASSKTCDKYNRYKEQHEYLLKRTRELAENRRKFVHQSVNNFVNNNISFAELAKSSTKAMTNNSETNTLQEFINESRNLFKISLAELIKKIKTFWTTYKQISTVEEKCFAYLDFVSSITT